MTGLAQVLGRIPRPSHPDLIVGPEHFSDAGVYRVTPELALVQTVDFFPPLVDDPYTFGQIAAANSLSDVYAMGGEPITALNIVGFPDDELPATVLADILHGGHDKVVESGAVIVGGHTVRDAEIKYGLAITGKVDPARVITNVGAREGDALVLTKPIGSGVLTSAAKLGHIEQDGLAEAVAVMTALNRPGARAMIEVGVSAATDVTGFGLLGHAGEMAKAAGVTFHLQAAGVPLLADTLRWARAGCLTRAYRTTRTFLGESLSVADGVDPVLVDVLMDAQTSGGLLISVPPDRTDRLVEALRREAAVCAAIIGRVGPASGKTLELD